MQQYTPLFKYVNDDFFHQIRNKRFCHKALSVAVESHNVIGLQLSIYFINYYLFILNDKYIFWHVI